MREADVDKTPIKGKPTPKKEAMRIEADRGHGQRVYDDVYTLDLRKLLDSPNPCISDGPYGPTPGLDECPMEQAIKGRAIVKRAVDVSPAAAMGQWGSYTRMEARIHREGCCVPTAHYIGRSTMQWRRIAPVGMLNSEDRTHNWICQKGRTGGEADHFAEKHMEITQKANPSKGKGSANGRTIRGWGTMMIPHRRPGGNRQNDWAFRTGARATNSELACGR